MTSDQLADRARISYRQLDFWVRRGYLKPSREWRGHQYGSGSPREWSARECQIATEMGALVEAGLRPEKAHEVARAGKADLVLAALRA